MERIEGLMIDGKISIEEEGMPSAPTRPPLSFPLWRYMSLEKYIHTLLTGGLFFSFPHQLDDPFGGKSTSPDNRTVALSKNRSRYRKQNEETIRHILLARNKA